MRQILRRRDGADRADGQRVIYRWDLDKTYLKSEFDSLRELLKISFEKAEDKVAVPGVAALIRGLRGTAIRREREVRVYFISASPPQIAKAILDKLALDGIEHEGVVFKDQLQRLVRGKFRQLREHVGFKLTELLRARCKEPADACEYLFGDDWESDPLVYSLYADVVAGRVSPVELGELLGALRVDSPLVDEAQTLAREIETADPVRRIFINLERPTPPANLRGFAARLVPTFNYLQTAACLYADDVLDEIGIEQVARSLLDDSSYSRERIANSLHDARRRGHLDIAAAWSLSERLRRAALLPGESGYPMERWRLRWQRLRWRIRAPRSGLRASPPMIDYRAVLRAEGPVDPAEG